MVIKILNRSQQICMDAGGACATTIDGYYIETAIGVALGFIWLLWKRKTFKHLQDLDEGAWKVSTNGKKIKT